MIKLTCFNRAIFSVKCRSIGLHRTVLAGLLVSGLADASGPDVFYGKWGSDTQCTQALIVEGGTKRAAPFDIQPDWLGHGEVWCRLTWASVGQSESGAYAVVHALCGEDNVRDYQLRLSLALEQLWLVWNGQIENGPLRRCPD